MLRFEGQPSQQQGGGGPSGSGTRGRKKRIVSTSGEDDSESEPAEAAKAKQPRRGDNASTAAATLAPDDNQQLLPMYEEYQHLVGSFDKTAELIASLEVRFTKLEELLEATASSAKTIKPRTTAAQSLPTPTPAAAGKKLKTKKQIREAAQAKVEELLTLLAD